MINQQDQGSLSGRFVPCRPHIQPEETGYATGTTPQPTNFFFFAVLCLSRVLNRFEHIFGHGLSSFPHFAMNPRPVLMIIGKSFCCVVAAVGAHPSEQQAVYEYPL